MNAKKNMYQELSTGIREKSRVEEQEQERKLIAPSTCALCAGWRLVIVLAVILAALMGLGRWTLQRQSASFINAAVTGRLAEFAAQAVKEIVGNLGGLRVLFPPGNIRTSQFCPHESVRSRNGVNIVLTASGWVFRSPQIRSLATANILTPNLLEKND